MRLISTVRADAPTSDTKTAKPVPQDTPESTTPDTDDIPDQEVANQTKFIKSIQQHGATESLVVFGLSAGYLSSTSQLALALEAIDKETLNSEVMVMAMESLMDAVKTRLADFIKETRTRTAEALHSFNNWLKESAHYVADNPKKVAVAIALLGGVLVIGTKMRSSLAAIKADQDLSISPDKQIAPVKIAFDKMRQEAERRMLAVTDSIDKKTGTNFRDTMGVGGKEVPIEVFQYDEATGEVKLVIETKGYEVGSSNTETLTLRKRLGEALETLGRLLEYVAELQYAISGKIRDYYKTNMRLVNGVHRNDNGTFEFTRPPKEDVRTGLMGLVKYTGAFALLYTMVAYIKGIFRWATKPSPKTTTAHGEDENVHTATA